MKNCAAWAVLATTVLSLLLLAAGVSACTPAGKTQVTFDQLFANPGKYNSREISIEGFYFHGFEIVVLSERLEYSGLAEGHLVPKGRMVWVSGGIPKEVYDALDRQGQMGPAERYGKVRMTGKFEYGGKYGHLGGYAQQITPAETEILPWSPTSQGFAIYLTREDIPPDKMEALSHVDIADQPVISMSDVITYNAQSYELKLTDEAFGRISELEVPVRGRSFVVCVDRQPMYWGAFWTPISSMSFDGVTIWKPLATQEPKVITLELGYPSASFYKGEDPRNNPAVIETLEQAGKLVNKLSLTEVDELPRSMKGYELYSWSEDNQWHFTLITGTNRTKTMQEITSSEEYVSETGWVKIHVVGPDAVKGVLSRLAKGESVFWCDELHIGKTTEKDLQLPPEQIIDAIKKHAELCGLDLMVPAP